ncbi:peptidase M48 [Thioalkalivibrio denitrificans]|uniref:Peptidase M48 n=1 Tax=Thioalkalivibrio denitrificans TaxID=108003 RepID=A0A1V3NFF6_9GAMM|nr:M48 family metallopeptidase [Thioalkalivibrio denitrificans]OOG23608.1 peptidase M48 [Thioalkalivibrio denitrificans]
MNFFEYQDRARRRSRWLLVLFLLAVVAILVVVNLAVLLALGGADQLREPATPGQFLARHLDVILWTSLLTGGVIGLASLYRTMSLRHGGAVIAWELGGTLVEPDTNDPLRRRLRNVVEEMAIASGVPVPDIFVLENEGGINAFAAGYSTGDAAIAVTQGALETLDRRELQGVVAHEFSHILNGDMRLNIRLMGILFGILVMGVIGRQFMYYTHHVSVRRTRANQGAAAFLLIGLALMLVGYVGLFFGRWIKAMVSRQREFLADASAVQFTREPEGIAGALKKIGAAGGSVLRANPEEVAHMLFANGALGQLFATHPPLLDRIRAIEPGFDPDEYGAIREKLRRHREAQRAAAEEAAREVAAGAPAPGGLALDADTLIEQMGHPGLGQVLAAALLVAAIPRPLERAAHSPEWAPELVCYLLLAPPGEVREQQLLMVAEARGADSEAQVRKLLDMEPRLAPELRIPLLEMAFPALKRRPDGEVAELLALVERLIHADGRVEVFEYALARMLVRHLEDARDPVRAATTGRRRLSDVQAPALALLGSFAHHGHPDDPEAARAALNAGLGVLGMSPVSRLPEAEGWHERMDAALERLDTLDGMGKQQLLRALVVTVTHGGKTVPAEAELLRAVCAVLHMPLPVLDAVQQNEAMEEN